MSDNPLGLIQAYADHAVMDAVDADWPSAAEQFQAAADVCRTEDRILRQQALNREPLVCTCLDPDPEPIGSCGRCHRLIP